MRPPRELHAGLPEPHRRVAESGKHPLPQIRRWRRGRRTGFCRKVDFLDKAGRNGAPGPCVVEEPGEQDDRQGAQQLRRPRAGAAQRSGRFAHIRIGWLGHPEPPDERHGRDKQQGQDSDTAPPPDPTGTWIGIRSGRPQSLHPTQAGIQESPEERRHGRREQDRPPGAGTARKGQFDRHGHGISQRRHLEAGHERLRAIEGDRRLVVIGRPPRPCGKHAGSGLTDQHQPADGQQHDGRQYREDVALASLGVGHALGGQLDHAVAADLERDRVRDGLVDAARQGRCAIPCRRRQARGEKCRGLVGIPEGPDLVGQRVVQPGAGRVVFIPGERQARRHDHVARVSGHARMQQTRIHVRREQRAVGEGIAQRLHPYQLVVHVPADQADCLHRVAVVVLQDFADETADIVFLRAALGPFDRPRLALIGAIVLVVALGLRGGIVERHPVQSAQV